MVIMDNISQPCQSNDIYLDGCALIGENKAIIARESNIVRVMHHEFLHLWLWHTNKPYGHTQEFRKMLDVLNGD